CARWGTGTTNWYYFDYW
nr:immunoglobulin heavy chain junction region [Macaca mulatta]MOV43615.1 immunoglobulin heavy chain junction region [Macaca mulatta]